MSNNAERSPFVDDLEKIVKDSRFKRLAAWGLLTVIITAVKDFYGVIAGTFILSFIGNTIISFLENQSVFIHGWLEKQFKCNIPRISRKALSFVYIVVVLYGLALGTIVTVPQVISSWRYLKQLLMSDNPYVELAGTIHALLGPDATSKLETFFSGVLGNGGTIKTATAPTAYVVLSAQLQRLLRGYLNTALPIINRLLKGSGKIFYQTMLSLLFSFILVFDKRAISRGVRRLGQPGSMVRFAYLEIGPKLSQFAQLVGKSLEAQLLIALWNTLLTTLGCLALGLPGTPFLAVLVFLCSFIPLAGVVMSTLPMCIIAVSEKGVSTIFQVILMVLGVHLVEAYVLNPQIYASKLHLHPLLVLVALYITEHVAGIGALFLAVPVTVFAMSVLLPDPTPPPAAPSPDPYLPQPSLDHPASDE